MKTASKIFWRSYFLQAVWNYERMQNIGFLFCIFPRLKELFGDDTGELKDACHRHITYFNTHPYMSLFIFGYVIKQEEDIKAGRKGTIEEMSRFKLQTAGLLAAIGDKLFWSTWRPLVGLLGVFLVYAGLKPVFLIPVIFILAYNIPVCCHKINSLNLAMKGKHKLPDAIQAIHNSAFIAMYPVAGLILVASIMMIIMFSHGLPQGLMFMFFSAATIFLRKCCNVSATKMLYLVSGVVIIGSMVI